MAVYRKLPVEVEAFVWTGNYDQLEDPEWIVKALQNGTCVIPRLEYCIEQYGGLKMEINTLEGVMLASVGDYIIKGIHNEIYACKSDIFEKTYERVGDTD